MNGLIIFILCQIALVFVAVVTGASCGAGLKNFMSAETFKKLQPSCMWPYLILAWAVIIVAAYFLWNSKLVLPSKKKDDY